MIERNRVFLMLALVVFSGCGVKGKPSAPREESSIGRGRPSYSKLVESLEKDEEPSEKKKIQPPQDQGGR